MREDMDEKMDAAADVQENTEGVEKRKLDVTLYGTPLSQADRRNVVAYCRKHRGYITVNQMRRKACLKKQCRYLDKVDNPYWQERAARRAAKKKRKAGL